MKNVAIQVEGDELVIRVNLKTRFEKSKSGKSVIVATTGGATDVPGFPEIKLGLNVYTK